MQSYAADIGDYEMYPSGIESIVMKLRGKKSKITSSEAILVFVFMQSEKASKQTER